MNNLIIPDISPLCRFCEEDDETFDHLYKECPALWSQRMDILGPHATLEDWTPDKVMAFLKIQDIQDALTTNITEEAAKKKQ